MVDEMPTENDSTFKLVKEKLDTSNIKYRLIEVYCYKLSIYQPKLVKNLLKSEALA